MRLQCPVRIVGTLLVLWAFFLVFGGCANIETPPADFPRELNKTVHPEYRIAPPDVLVINAVRVVPKPPYHVQPLDVLTIVVAPSLPDQPIGGPYAVEPDGTVDLGFAYGSVNLVDKTLAEAKTEVTEHLKNLLKGPFQVSVSLAQARGQQQVRGDHLVKQDGRIGLGTYGSVLVAGLTLIEARAAIEGHLSQFLVKPEVSVDVSGFNSRVYYVISDGGGFGEQVYRLPITGNETVLDGVAQVFGLGTVASKHHIWLARPAPSGSNCDQKLPVDWIAITQRGQTATNYQVFPGDRIFVMAKPIITFDTQLQRFISPVERIFGIILLGHNTFNNNNNNGVNR